MVGPTQLQRGCVIHLAGGGAPPKPKAEQQLRPTNRNAVVSFSPALERSDYAG